MSRLKHWSVLAGLALAAGTSTALAAPTITTTPTKLAPLGGTYATPAPGQGGIGFYGTDLGITYQHGTKLRVLYGDSWSNTLGVPIGPLGDDAQGNVDLLAFPNGASVTTWVGLPGNAPPPGDFPWHAKGPPVTMRINAIAKVAPLVLYDGGFGGPLLTMGLGRTPVAGFSNGGTGAFAIFTRSVYHQCSNAAPCPNSYTCDTAIGICAGTSGETAVPCVNLASGSSCPGAAACNPVPGAGGGICRDNTFGVANLESRLLSTVQDMRVGNSDIGLNIEEQYYTKVWPTNKFTNVVARTVVDYTPGGAFDYHTITNSTPAPPKQPKVFLWGRAGFVGAKSQGRALKLYFAYVNLPTYSANATFAWTPNYRTAAGGYSTVPGDAAGVTLNDVNETFDIVDQMSISFVPTINKWVMLYGGDIPQAIISGFATVNTPYVQHDPQGAIHFRWADHPWGPWSTPALAYAPGNPNFPATGDYAPWGMIHSTGCFGVPCVPGEANPVYLLTPFGFLYGPNIVDVWTQPQGVGLLDADIYWNVSTWDPYETVLLRSRITH